MSFTPATLFKKLKNNKKILLFMLIMILAGGLLWYRSQKSTDPSVQPQTVQVEKGTLVVSIASSGQVLSTNSKTVTTNVTGVVKKIYVQNDQVIKMGEKLIELELDQDSQQTYTQALASYQSAKNSLASAQANLYSLQAAMLGKWDDFKELAESESYKDTASANRSLPEFHIPEKEWLAAEAQYKNQQSVVAQAQTALSSASQSLRLSSPILYAPISGKLSGLSLMNGTVLNGSSSDTSTSQSTGQSIASITTDARPTVTVNLTEIDVTKVQLNDKATITLDALTDKTYTGKVMSIDTVGAVSSGVTSYPAAISFDTAASEVFSNMSAQVNIITDTKTDIIVVPSTALQTQNGQSFVRVLRNDQTEQVVVETGLSSGTQTEITSGLNEGDTIVTSTVQPVTTARSGTQTTSPFSGLGGAGGFGGGSAVRIPR